MIARLALLLYFTIPCALVWWRFSLGTAARTLIVLILLREAWMLADDILRCPSGPERRFHLRFVASSYAALLLNPRILGQSLAIFWGQLLRMVSLRPHVRDDETSIAYDLPFVGSWSVISGGVTPQTSHSWSILNQRYAYDFVARALSSPTGDGPAAAGEPVLAPADGVVVRVRSDVPDSPHVGTGWVDLWTKDVRGNFVVIRHDECEYSLVAHLQLGSVTVRVGDAVMRGQPLARCGNSGRSTEPHIHFHVQDRESFYIARSRPIRWSARVRALPDASVSRSGAPVLTRGQRVRNED